MQQEPSFIRGAVDLSARRTAPAASEGTAATGSWVIDVTEANFQAEVMERSLTVPVVLDLWADWCQPCKQLSPILERLADEAGGRWVLAKIDVDANQRLAAAFGVQGIPAVFAVIKGQPLPLFTGALPETHVRQYLDELMRVATANGVTGTVPPVSGAGDGQAPGAFGEADTPGPSATAGEPVAQTGSDESEAGTAGSGDPELDEASAAVAAGDLDSAVAAYERVLAHRPDDDEARSGVAAVKLVQRTNALDPVEVRKAATDRPEEVAIQIDAADLDMIDGNVEQAFARLIDAVRLSAGDERNRARTHLLALFEVAGAADPRVAKARTELANALF